MTRRLWGVVWLLGAAACTQGRPQRQPRSEGERLYYAKCSGCHNLKEPRELTPEKWVESVASMERNKRVRLEQDERALVLGYLTGGVAP